MNTQVHILNYQVFCGRACVLHPNIKHVATGMAIENSEAPALIESAKCLSCIPPGMQTAVQIYLLQQIATNTMTASELVAAAKCLSCIPPGEQDAVIIYLLSQIVNA